MTYHSLKLHLHSLFHKLWYQFKGTYNIVGGFSLQREINNYYLCRIFVLLMFYTITFPLFMFLVNHDLVAPLYSFNKHFVCVVVTHVFFVRREITSRYRLYLNFLSNDKLPVFQNFNYCKF